MERCRRFLGPCCIVILATMPGKTFAGMPALLPTEWTVGSSDGQPSDAADSTNELLWQGISFFLACLLATSFGLKLLWNALHRDVPALPPLTYPRAVSFVLLWGFVFVIVLTMISGARELMTPGAWRKQGWTYRLDQPLSAPDATALRRRALEDLRFALWNHAATHDGGFPEEAKQLQRDDVWQIPGWAGLQFLYVPGQSPNEQGRLLAFEPELSGKERLVLLTNGFIGSMRTPEIEQGIAGDQQP